MDRCIIITGIKLAPVSAALIVTASLLLAACGGGGGSTPNTPVVTPTVGPTSQPTTRGTASPSPTTTPTTAAQAAAYVCPTTGTASIARSSSAEGSSRHMPGRVAKAQAVSAYTQLAVTYSRPMLAANLARVASTESALGVKLVHSYDYPSQSTAIRVVSVPTSQVTSTEASLRSVSGVTSIAVTGQRRYHATTSALYTTDPYFTGQSPTKETPPYSESSSNPGQWDMHVIGLENAFGYSVAGTTYTSTSNALGSSSIKIAIIDTGEDAGHPELNNKIAYQKCFITNDGATPVVQSTGNFSTDEDGHGTDVSGIAAAATNNNLGFAGAGGNAMIYAYRVFPTPDDNCANSNSNDNQCSSDTADIAGAINDAVAKGVNVISMSLGGGTCSAGVDDDPTEGAAVKSALMANVIVVAAAGNAGGQSVDAPACISGVIAVGASALYDGTLTGTTTFSRPNVITTGTAMSPVEYVPSYSQYGTTNTYQSAQSWGIVAPGGDPSANEGSTNVAADDLHWIENIWTSTPFLANAGDTNFTGNCAADYNGTIPGLSTTGDCRTLIAGTSMATPHVAGAVALILAVAPSYQTPAAMKTLLCTTADNLGGDTHQGCGRLNVYRAMAHAIGDTMSP